MRFLKCFALGAAIVGILSLHVNAAQPVTGRAKKAMKWQDRSEIQQSQPSASNPCPSTDEGTLISGGVAGAGGTWAGDTTGNTDDFDDDYPAACSYGTGNGGLDEIHHFQVDTTGVWNFNTSMACWDTSLGLRVDSGGGCPGDAVACDGDALNDCYYESSLDAFLVAGTDYYLVIDSFSSTQFGPYTLNWSLVLPACTSDAACDDLDPCNGTETCDLPTGECLPGTPPCTRAQTCNPDGSCTDPDGCIIYSNYTQIGGYSTLGGGTNNTLVADDWGFSTNSQGRNLLYYDTTVVGTSAPYTVATTLWGHGLNCVGGSVEGDQCDVDGDCPGLLCVGGVNDGLACASDGDCLGLCTDATTPCSTDADCTGLDLCDSPAAGVCPLAAGTCQDLGFYGFRQRPTHTGELGGTLCIFGGIPTGYYVNLNCAPGPGAVMPAEGAWQVIGFIGAGTGPALAGITPEIGTSSDIFGWDETPGVNGTHWERYWFSGGNLANWVGDLCTDPIGACCTPDVAAGASCSIVSEADCTGGGGTYIGDNNAVHEFDCGADGDGDGTPDVCDPCPSDNPDDTDADGVCDSDDPCPVDNPDDPDGDGLCSSVDPCPADAANDADGDGFCESDEICDNDPFKQDPGHCGCGTPDTDADGDGVFDCDDGCPNDPNKSDPGICGCGAGDGDSDGDGVADCNDQCPGVDDGVYAPECAGAIPTVSEWGLVVLGLLLLAAGKVYFGRRKAMA